VKRFYREVTVAPSEGRSGVLLDGRPIRTPGRALLAVPSDALAAAIADEWEAQGESIAPHTMPLTGIANAAIDLVAPDPAAFTAPLALYGESDLFCYRAPEADLAAEEAKAWNAVLEWAETRFGVEFALASGVMHVAQPAGTAETLGNALLALDPFRLAALAPIVTIGGSLVAGLALVHGALDSEALWQAVTLDERWQEERWGEDADATAARERRHEEWQAAARFLTLLA
jgi:chaperone required for assembly of F1-ATPase